VIKPNVDLEVFGWYDDPRNAEPAHDPGTSGLCAFCRKTLGEQNIGTISFVHCVYQFYSFFYRYHAECYDEERAGEVESSVMDDPKNLLPWLVEKTTD